MTGTDDLAILCGAIFGAATLAGGLGAGMALARRLASGRCSCGHSLGCVDKFTGNCTATVVQVSWVGGVRRTRKVIPCPCREHRRQQAMAVTS